MEKVSLSGSAVFAVSCALITPDDKYLCVVDNGIDQIKVYTVNQTNGKLKLYDIIR